ncbi:MAG: hypothetical protein Ct9H300mP16_11860 [Pseudomonadota bacterium]|nr:MAG: hypothetical protein Ct9H300mP16_11860 [Pseudomonadota bacterium]
MVRHSRRPERNRHPYRALHQLRISAAELRSGNPIIGIAQTGSDLVPCNRIHVDLVRRIRDGIRGPGGIAIEFPVHPVQESGKRPTAALDRNLQYLSLVEVLFGYPLDGVVLTTGCDKTTPAMLMGAATVDIPAIALSGGPMLNGYWRGKLAGSGTILWEARKLLAEGEIDDEEFVQLVADATPSPGHCNTMGTATTMNSIAEALGMSLPGSPGDSGTAKERAGVAYRPGRRIVAMVGEDLTPSKILKAKGFEKRLWSIQQLADQPMRPFPLNAIARHANVPLDIGDWQSSVFPSPCWLTSARGGVSGRRAHHQAGGSGGYERVVWPGKNARGALKVAGPRVKGIFPKHLRLTLMSSVLTRSLYGKGAGFVVSGETSATRGIMKTFCHQRRISRPISLRAGQGGKNFEVGRSSSTARRTTTRESTTRNSMSMRTAYWWFAAAAPGGYPGSAEVVNMQPPDALIREGVRELPTLGDGRQSGTSGSPSILNASPESAVGGGLALLNTGDRLRIDLNQGTLDVCISDQELADRQAALKNQIPEHQTPWQEIYRDTVGQLATGGIIELATKYPRIRHVIPVTRTEHRSVGTITARPSHPVCPS